jgi:hypothetical protein
MTERDLSRGMALPPVVRIPRPLLAAMPQLAESHFRAFLFLLAHAKPATLPEIAAGTGIGEGRLARAMIDLAQRRWVEVEPSGEVRLGPPVEGPTTPVPRILLSAMPESEAEYLRPLLYLIDRAYSDARRDRPATLSQIASGTGIGKERVMRALSQIQAEGWCVRTPAGAYVLARAGSAPPESGRRGGQSAPPCGTPTGLKSGS